MEMKITKLRKMSPIGSAIGIDPRTGMAFQKHHHSVKKLQTPSVSKRNARERNRVKQVNDGFLTLRNHIPHLKNKTSKVDTLRAAADYIRTLRTLLGHAVEDDYPEDSSLLSETDDSQDEEMSEGKESSPSLETNYCSLVSSLPPILLIESPNSQSSLNVFDDLKENLTDNYKVDDEIGFTGEEQINWNWTDNNSIDEQ